jgi:hypothetical protein
VLHDPRMMRVEPREIIALCVERFRLGGNDGAGLRVDFDMRAGALARDLWRRRLFLLQFLQSFLDPFIRRRRASLALLVGDSGEDEFDFLQVRLAFDAAVVPVDPDLPIVFAWEGGLKEIPRPLVGSVLWPQRRLSEHLHRTA